MIASSIRPFYAQAYQLVEGVYFPEASLPAKTYHKKLWDEIGSTYYGSDVFDQMPLDELRTTGYAKVVGQTGGLWFSFPEGKHVGTILEVGCGYGRASINLSLGRQLTCDRYIGLDISEPLLRRLQHFKNAYDFYPGADFTLICQSAEQLPLEDNSVDLIISNAVLMHIEKPKVQMVLNEMARILKPGGAFVLNNSFHNRACPAHVVRNGLRFRLAPEKRSVYTQQYTRSEIESMLTQSGIASKCGGFKVTINPPFMLLPQALGRHRFAWAENFNQRLNPSGIWREILADAFNAYSLGAIAE